MLRMIYATIIIFTYLISVLKVDTEQPLFIYLFIYIIYSPESESFDDVLLPKIPTKGEICRF